MHGVHETPDSAGIPVSLLGSVFLDGADLVVAHGAAQDPQVLSLESRLRREGRALRRRVVSQQEIEKLRREHSHVDAMDSSVVQKEARKLFEDAMKKGASDIHVHILERANYGRVLLRTHGLLEEYKQLALKDAKALTTAIYTAMSGSSDSNYCMMRNQDASISDGKFLPEGVHGIRVARGPNMQGEDMVLRLIYEGGTGRGENFEERMLTLGYHKTWHLPLLRALMRRPTGITLFTGPTGSGKSSTLKCILESIGQENPGLSLRTVEDPPEYPIANAVQMDVTNTEDKDGRVEKFSDAIKSAMRRDPDVLMIGEVRDEPSARLALQAAMTGHQVWTTLHANSAWDAVARMAEIMLKPEFPAPLQFLCNFTVLSGMVSQRLVPVLCPRCKRPLGPVGDMKSPINDDAVIAPDFRARLEAVLDFTDLRDASIRGPGCAHCEGRGIVGRTVVAEVALTDPALLDMVKRAGVDEVKREWKLQRGGKSIVDHALLKILAGDVDPRMAEAVIGPLAMDDVLRDGVIAPEEAART